MSEVEEKKQLAEKYQTLAQTNREAFEAFRLEMEGTLRNELIRQSEKGKGIRRMASFIVWLITLTLEAVLGTYFKDLTAWFKNIFA